MKRKYWLWAAVALLALLWLAFFAPHRLFKANVEYGRCEFYSAAYPQGEYWDLTAEQADDVLEILSKLWCFRVWGEERHSLDDRVLEMTLFIDEKPVYIVLGKRDYVYDGASGLFRQFDIIGGDKATAQILAVLGLDEAKINGRRQ